MAVLFMDSFDHCTVLGDKWNVVAYASAGDSGQGGRNDTNGLIVPVLGSCTKTLPSSYGTLVVGFAAYFPAFGITFFTILDLGSIQIKLAVNADGTISISRGNLSVLATSSNALRLNRWEFLEVKVTIDNSAGSIELRVNEVEWINESGIDTQETANATVNGIKFSTGSGTTYYDDLYVLDTSGSVNNDFIGDHRVEAILPDGAGNYAQWTASAGSNYENVDDNPPDDDTTYNYQGGTGLPKIDSHTMGNLATTSGTVAAVQTALIARKDDSGAVTVEPFIRQGGSDYAQTSVNFGDDYEYYLEVLENDPDTAAAWTVGGVNSVEFGYRRSA